MITPPGSDPAVVIKRTVDRYRGTRGHVAALVDVVDRHLDHALAQARRDGGEYERGRLDHAETMLAMIEESRDRWQAIAEQHGKRLRDARALRVGEEADGEERVKVTIEHDASFEWCVAELEEVAYRLRVGGATDETVVEVSARRIVASVPAPNVITLEPVGRRTPPERPSLLSDPVVPTSSRRELVITPVGATAMIAFAMVVWFIVVGIPSIAWPW